MTEDLFKSDNRYHLVKKLATRGKTFSLHGQQMEAQRQEKMKDTIT